MSEGRRFFGLLAFLVLGIWGAAVHFGLGAAVLGPDRTAASEGLLLLPGVCLALTLLWWEARRRLRPVEARWQPKLVRQAPEPAEPPSLPLPAPRAAAAEPRRVPVVAPKPAQRAPVVRLGSAADPAFAVWQLRWDAGAAGSGRLPLPFGDHVLVGRDPDAHILAELEPISRRHLELQVRETDVTFIDLGSSNGTFTPDGQPASPRQPYPLAVGQSVRLAEPWALELTLEPLAGVRRR